ncbi:hypothetical protein EP331_15970 [bacterium]|nr:MAG: hypothetical protein EP331_15970 [bacterium]
MIANKNINPERDLYYLGGRVIEQLDTYEGNAIDYFELYDLIKQKLDISINLFTLVLDWLFILGTIKKGTNGRIVKCF